jgi:2-polyprenyl-3-methyl-5-hydroxy-6-metoxy-1,4-benzoquinol methylase
VDAQAANEYSQHVDQKYSVTAEIDKLEHFCGGLRELTLLDVGAGPGNFSVECARRGASVVWHDISNNYRRIAADRAQRHGVTLEYSVGYLEDIAALAPRRFDVVFNRSSYFYSMDDRVLARRLYDAVAPAGCLAVFCIPTTQYARSMGTRPNAREWLNSHLGLKIGHPMTPPGRVASLLARFPHQVMISETRSNCLEDVLLRKPGPAPT